MQVEVISSDTIKPSSPTPPHLQTFQISFIDKMMPVVYIPFISFYPSKRVNSDSNHILLLTNHLKSTLSETLTRFYPLAGRIKDDFNIDCNDKGVLFVTSRVNCGMTQLLATAQPKIESFDRLALLWPEPNGEQGHQIGIQLNIFSCGGLGLYVCFCHKIIDATTIAAFMKCWSAISCGCSSSKALYPNFPAASLFPLRKEREPTLMPSDLMKYWNVKWLLREGNGTIKRFVFEAGSISGLKDKARSERVPNPTRVEAVSSFIWKHCIDASTKVWGSQQPSTLTQMVDLRRRMVPLLSEYSVGNIIWKTVAHYDTIEDEEADDDVDVDGLVFLLRRAVNKTREELVPKLQSINKQYKAMQEFLKEERERCGNSKTLINPYEFTSWVNMGLNQVDFGWGKPIWVSLIGKKDVPKVYKNSIYLMEGETSDKIEAWMMLGHHEMVVLEGNPEFLAFANPNPPICFIHDPTVN